MFRRNWAKLLLIPLVLLVSIIDGHVRVRGYYRKDGTYVRSHYRTAPPISLSLPCRMVDLFAVVLRLLLAR